jgi:hypothetical protein
MNNMYATPAGAGPADRPYPGGTTDPFSSARARNKRRLRWGVGITLAGFLAGGGIALAVSSGSPGTVAASTAPAASQVQGTMLNSELETASSTASAVLPRIRWALARLRLLGGIHGEFTFHYDGGYRTLAFERGTIQSVNGNDVVVVAKDGTTWTWLIVSDTVVRQNGSKTTTGALSPGQTVFAGGPVVNAAKDARLIVIKASSGGSGTSSSGSVSGPAGTSVN